MYIYTHTHPHPGGGGVPARLLEEAAGAVDLVVVVLQLHRRQVDLLVLGVGAEGLGQDLPRAPHVTCEPLFLGAHEPERPGLGAEGRGL